MGTSTTSAHFLGTFCSCHAIWTKSSKRLRKLSQQLTFTISGRMPDLSPAFSFWSFPTTLTNSSVEGNLAISDCSGHCLVFPISSALFRLWMFSTLAKCLLHLSFCAAVVMHRLPSSSLMVACLIGTRPLRPHWGLVHCHTSLMCLLEFIWEVRCNLQGKGGLIKNSA